MLYYDHDALRREKQDVGNYVFYYSLNLSICSK